MVDVHHGKPLAMQMSVYAYGQFVESCAIRLKSNVLSNLGDVLNVGANNLMVAGKSRY